MNSLHYHNKCAFLQKCFIKAKTNLQLAKHSCKSQNIFHQAEMEHTNLLEPEMGGQYKLLSIEIMVEFISFFFYHFTLYNN